MLAFALIYVRTDKETQTKDTVLGVKRLVKRSIQKRIHTKHDKQMMERRNNQKSYMTTSNYDDTHKNPSRAESIEEYTQYQ